jgi:ATP-binding protein involved in chromosome partitioning
VGIFSRNKNDGQLTPQLILDALRTVQDPDLHKDLVSLGMIQDLKIDGSKVSFSLVLTTPACPMKAKMEQECREAVSAIPGVEEIEIHVTANTAAHHGRPEKIRIPGVKNIIAVSSGKGGVGKSTVAVNLALALKASGASVGLMDADAYGPNIPQMMGVSEQPTSDGQKIYPPERDGMKIISVGLIAQGDMPVIWRGPMIHSLIQQFLHDVDWGELDYLVVDMPPGTGDAQLSLSQLVPLSGAVMVTTPQEVSLSDVRRAIMMFRKVEVPVLGIVENMAYFLCPDNGKTYEIFGKGAAEKLASEYHIASLGRIPIDPRIAAGGDAGDPIVLAEPDSELSQEFRKVAGTVAQQISIANKIKQPLPIIE